APQQEPSRLPESTVHANQTSQTEQKHAYTGHKRNQNSVPTHHESERYFNSHQLLKKTSS
ncbi:hypothetical protein, partial [Secundilactobacillus muriivasis]